MAEEIPITKLKKEIEKERRRIAKARRVFILEYILFLLPVAGLNDILDFIEITGILKIVTLFIDFITALLIIMWYMFRQGRLGAPRFFFRFIGTIVVELIPFIGIFPVWTVMVTYEFLKGRVIRRKVPKKEVEKRLREVMVKQLEA